MDLNRENFSIEARNRLLKDGAYPMVYHLRLIMLSVQPVSLTNLKFTPRRNPVEVEALVSPQDAFSSLLKYNAFHQIHRQTLLLFARTSYFEIKAPCNSQKITELHNFNFNFVARNFVISPKKSSLLFRV